MKKLCIVWLALVNLSIHAQENGGVDFFEFADSFFKKYVANGQVDYLALYNNPDELDVLIASIEREALKDKTAGYQKAFWMNAYNILVIKSIVEKRGLKSPKDDRDFFSGEKHRVAGELLTLDEIERNMLHGAYEDERLHFGLVCGAEGCPSLAAFSYHPDSVEQQLLAQTIKVFNDGKFIRVDDAAKTVEVSKIFDWYRKDFEKTGLDIVAYINQYRIAKIPAGYKVTYSDYDWRLNIKKE